MAICQACTHMAEDGEMLTVGVRRGRLGPSSRHWTQAIDAQMAAGNLGGGEERGVTDGR